MSSIVGKRQGNATYYYLVESARVDGKPRIVSQQYAGYALEVITVLLLLAGAIHLFRSLKDPDGTR